MARRREDPKVQALREERCLNPRPEAVRDPAFASSEFLDARDLVQVKYEMVRRVRVEGDAVSRTVADYGFSRPSFYEAAAALDAGGLAGLVPARPGPRRAHKMSDEVVAFAQERLRGRPRAACGRSGRPDRRPFRGAGPPSVDRAGPGQGRPAQKRRTAMNAPTGPTWSAMRRCGHRRSVGGRQAGAMVWPSSKAGGWPPGCEPRRSIPPVSSRPAERPTINGEVDGDLVGVLAAMALAVVG